MAVSGAWTYTLSGSNATITNYIPIIEDTGDTGHTITYSSSAIGIADFDTPFYYNVGNKFGNAGIYFANGAMTIPHSSDWNFGSDDFTMDFWGINLSFGLGTDHTIFFGNNFNFFYDYSEDKVNFMMYNEGSLVGHYTYTADETNYPMPGSFEGASWCHYEIVRDGSNFYIFINGTSVTLTEVVAISTNSITHSTNNSWYIGNTTGGITGTPYRGAMDEIRVSKGIARHTTNFTPPTSAYTSDSYTKLLLSFEADLGITIPTTLDGYSVVGLGLYAIKNKGITSVTINHAINLDDECLANNSGLAVILNANVTTSVAFTSPPFEGCSIGNGLTISEGVTTIPDYLFYNCGLTSVTLPSTLTTLGAICFSANSLNSVTLKSNVTCNLSTLAPFYGGSVSAITIEEGVTSIPAAFLQTSAANTLSELILPSTLTTLGSACFTNCDIGTLTLQSNVTCGLATSAPFYNGSVSAITIEEGVTSIPGSFMYFGSPNSISTLTLPSTLTTLGSNCFYNCDIGTLTLQSNITCGLATSAPFFDGSITKAIIAEGVTTTPNSLFYSSDLKEVIYGSTVTSIGASSMYNNDNLSKITFLADETITFGTNVLAQSTPSPKGNIYGLDVSVYNWWNASYTTYYDFAYGAAPTVTTTDPATNITESTADVEGEVVSDGGIPITERGFVYAITTNPTTADSKVTVSGTTGTFSATLTNLSIGVTYYTRAYAINAVDTSYGDNVSFSPVSSGISEPSTATVTPLIQILDYLYTLVATASTTSATVLLDGTTTLAEDDFLVNTTRNNTSRRIDNIPTAGIFELNATIPNQAQDDIVRCYKFMDHSDLIKQETISYNERIQGGGDLSFRMVTDGTYIPRAGQYVRLFLNNNLYYTGMINTVTRQLPQNGITEKIFFDVTTTQLKIVPPRRTITVNYDIDTTCSTIVTDVINNYLVDEGFMAGTINDGAKLSEQWLDDCISIGDVLDQCANLSGFQWYIDENFDVQFMQDPTTVSTCSYAISDLDDTFTDFRNVTVEETIDNYTNKIFVAGGNDQNGNLVIVGQTTTASVLEMQDYAAGSGVWGRVERNSSVNKAEYEVAEAGTTESTIYLGTATMASLTITVGDEVYNDTRGVRSTVASITVTSFDIVTAITGQTAGDDIAIYSDANQIARNILKRQDQIPKRISFETYSLGFRAGQELQVALSTLSMSTTQSYIVEEVNIGHISSDYFKSTVRAILRNADNLSTQKNPDAWDFYKNLGASATKRAGYGPQRGAINPKYTVSAITPSNPKINDIFKRTSPTPSTTYWYDGTTWQE